MHSKGDQQKEGWPTLTGSLKGSESQVPSVVLLVVRGRQHLGQAEQQLSQRRQQMPSHHIQLEVLRSPRNSGVTGQRTLPSLSGKGGQAESVIKRNCMLLLFFKVTTIATVSG